VANIHIEIAVRINPINGILYGKFAIAGNNSPIALKMIISN
jgi:hypothetical protein